MEYSIWAWVGFAVFILFMLALDLGVLNRKSHAPSYREATIWSIVWVTLAMIFAGIIFWRMGSLTGKEFLAGYLIELSLSVDNLFVFLLVFSYFKVPAKYQHRVLFWGVLGALVMRITMIGLGAALINRFHWIIYVFGVFLIYTGLKMLRQEETDVKPEDNPVVKLVTRFIPITRHYDGEKFFTNVNGKRTGTLMLLVLVIVEVTDLVFAVDSIPAIFGITTNTFIVYTSNVFAILGLRSLYFLLAGVVEKFHYLKIGLSIVLTFVGVKMLAEGYVAEHLGLDKETIIGISLGFVGLVLVGSVVVSLIWPKEAETNIEVELPPGFDSPFDDDQGRLGGEDRELPKA
ncbi:MAG TPA: TerC family protein [Pyrinomonadaceae bacterium]|jgi:tellurite resistance protein TerC|nr:TerC family protein [Pyrinomonadaceae bacterium]